MALAEGTRPEQLLAMLFSDVEASTEHLSRLGSAYDEALARHHAIIRSAVETNSGQEVENAGDGFFMVFDSVDDAVAAAAVSQRGLHHEPWPEQIEFRVRMGIHFGVVRWRRGLGFNGLEVHRTSRIADAANGGQCLVSSAVRDALLGSGFDEQSIVDRGRHHLKGFGDEPERLFELVIDGHSDNRPLRARSLETPELPTYSTPLVGRDAALAELDSALTIDGTRMVSVVGPGGVGKTRLVVEFLRSQTRDSRVRVVDLSQLELPELLEPTIAEGLGIPVFGNFRPTEALVDYLFEERTLLVLDNFEQLVSSGEVISDLLNAVPHLHVIVTSRLPLRIRSERLLWLDPLPVGRDVDPSAAVQLFCAIAEHYGPNRIGPESAAQVAAICRDLDGLPLAIELAASRVRSFGGIDQLAAALKEPLAVLRSGAGDSNDRHGSISNTIDFSTRLLSPGSQQLLSHLSVLPGGATTASLAAISGMSTAEAIRATAELVDGGLVTTTVQPNGQSRLSTPRLIREYGTDRLRSAGDLPVVRRATADHLCDLAFKSSMELLGRSQHDVMTQLEADLDNFRAMFSWLDEQPELSDSAVAVAADLVTYWWLAGPREGLNWLMQLADGHGHGSRHRPRALVRSALLASWLGETDTVIERAGLGVELCRSRDRPTATLSHGLQLLALAWAASGERGSRRRALDAVKEGLAIDAHLPDQVRAVHLTNHADVFLAFNQLDRSRPLFEESIAIFEREGENWLVAAPRSRLGQIALRQGRLADARSEISRSVQLWSGAHSHSGLARALAGLGRVALAEGGDDEAGALHHEAWRFVRSMRSFGEAPWVLAGMGAHQLRADDADQGLHTFAAAAVLGRAFGQPVLACIRHELGDPFSRRSPARRRHLQVLVEDARSQPVEQLLALGDKWCQ